ncbi:MAG: ABC transporter ATP-binding protein [Candidatus Korarchaeota archaeon]|nr:ABC transporter ATP-binding protein [Candidatus Korarchaeota archaeon]
MELLRVASLSLSYKTRKGPLKAVNNVSFSIKKGETLALVGESGSGKTSTATAILRIVPRNVHEFKGIIELEGVNLMKLSEDELRRNIRWKKISMVFQGAMEALNPLMKVGDQIAEPLIIHQGYHKEEAMERVKELLRMVGLPEYVAERYPHELSGGMKQRAVISMALALQPIIVILDEPTSALDVITQANLMNLLKELKWKLGISYIFITHDLPLASELADKVAVMYAGRIVEIGPAEQIYLDPKHPYTKKLIFSVPALRMERAPMFIPGEPPNLINPPPGCPFSPRCDEKIEICEKEVPTLKEIDPEHMVACWLY